MLGRGVAVLARTRVTAGAGGVRPRLREHTVAIAVAGDAVGRRSVRASGPLGEQRGIPRLVAIEALPLREGPLPHQRGKVAGAGLDLRRKQGRPQQQVPQLSCRHDWPPCRDLRARGPRGSRGAR